MNELDLSCALTRAKNRGRNKDLKIFLSFSYMRVALVWRRILTLRSGGVWALGRNGSGKCRMGRLREFGQAESMNSNS